MAPGPTTNLIFPNLKTLHKKPYPAISPSNLNLSQSGRTVLVTGGGSGIGYSIAQSFLQASAAKLIVIGRRKDVIDKAVSEFEAEAKSINSPTQVIGRAADAADPGSVAKLWTELKGEGIYVDVLVLNHAVAGPGKPILQVDLAEEWKVFEINVRGLLDFIQWFWKQGGDKKKYVVSVSTSVIHNWWTEATFIPSYGLTKASGLTLTQQIANDVPADKLQIVSFHPGAILTPAAKDAGVSEEMLDWDDVKLPGDFAVWASTDEAEFLHGRWIDGHWDVDEMKKEEFKQRLDKDPNLLRIGLGGLQRTAELPSESFVVSA